MPKRTTLRLPHTLTFASHKTRRREKEMWQLVHMIGKRHFQAVACETRRSPYNPFDPYCSGEN